MPTEASTPQVTGTWSMKSCLKGKGLTIPLTGNTMPLTEASTNFQITQGVTGGARLAVNGNVKLYRYDRTRRVDKAATQQRLPM